MLRAHRQTERVHAGQRIGQNGHSLRKTSSHLCDYVGVTMETGTHIPVAVLGVPPICAHSNLPSAVHDGGRLR
eukprot:m.574745 g.574745  ORF g.574745 m.574745 type:complete len:73 (-) comp22282_c0_seq4:2490-2708(-)